MTTLGSNMPWPIIIGLVAIILAIAYRILLAVKKGKPAEAVKEEKAKTEPKVVEKVIYKTRLVYEWPVFWKYFIITAILAGFAVYGDYLAHGFYLGIFR